MGTVTEFKSRAPHLKRYVRVTGEDRHGNIEFQFSIDDPSLYLEMTLPPAAFEEFCANEQARLLTEEQGREVDSNERRWRFGDEED